jgi:hypothetical protein
MIIIQTHPPRYAPCRINKQECHGNIILSAGNIFIQLNSSAFILEKSQSQSGIGVTNDSFYLQDYPERPFPHVLIYSTLLAILSIAVVGLVSFNVAF